MITTTTAHKCNKDAKANESLLPDLASSHGQEDKTEASSNDSISITQITTTQTSQPKSEKQAKRNKHMIHAMELV